MTPRPPISTLFPYTTLFRSRDALGRHRVRAQVARRPAVVHDPAVALHLLEEAGHRAHIESGGVQGLEADAVGLRSEEHTSELQSQSNLVCRLLLEKKNTA